jgi:transposase InsO family protein
MPRSGSRFADAAVASGRWRPSGRPQSVNKRWSLNFLSATSTDGRRFRILAVIDDFTRECLCLVAGTSPSGARVARELDAVIAWRGKPSSLAGYAWRFGRTTAEAGGRLFGAEPGTAGEEQVLLFILSTPSNRALPDAKPPPSIYILASSAAAA